MPAYSIHRLAQLLSTQKKKKTLSETFSWTSDKICGKGPFSSNKKRLGLSPGVLVQTAQAALAAWRAISATGALTTPLTKISQGSQESYAQFVARLQEAAERSLGPHENEGLLVKRLALKNANSACKAALRGKTRGLDLTGMIKLCSEVDIFSHQVSKSINLAIGVVFQKAGGTRQTQQSLCFRCGILGHYAHECLSTRPGKSATIPGTGQVTQGASWPLPQM